METNLSLHLIREMIVCILGYENNTLVIVTHGIVKKTQKPPAKDSQGGENKKGVF